MRAPRKSPCALRTGRSHNAVSITSLRRGPADGQTRVSGSGIMAEGLQLQPRGLDAGKQRGVERLAAL